MQNEFRKKKFILFTKCCSNYGKIIAISYNGLINSTVDQVFLFRK
jgi:hypothetical protein